MSFVTVQTSMGPQRVRVCDYCKTVIIPSGRFCSGHCARNAAALADLSQCENLDDQGNRCGERGTYREGAKRYLCTDCAEGYETKEQPQ